MRPLCTSFGLLFLLLAACADSVAGPAGSFRGTIVDAPQSAPGKKWIYVQGRNGAARRVEISRAKVTYDEEVPAANRASNPSDALVPGAEVRVTAEQGSDGEWWASGIEILKAAVRTQQSAQCRRRDQEVAPIAVLSAMLAIHRSGFASPKL